jgi:hypothetical protein
MERSELERALRALRDEVEYPRTPPIAERVDGILRDESTTRPRAARPPDRLSLRRAVAVALLATLVATAGVVAAVPSVRDALLDLIDLQGATVETTTAPPPPPPSGLPDLGRATTLAEARDELEFDPLLPAGLGAPDRVFVRTGVPGGELAIVYDRVTVSQFRGDLLPAYVAKLVPVATDVDRLRVEGNEAVWISGAPHFFAYRGPSGIIEEERIRAAGNVLLIERGRLLIRIEGELSQARAVRIARSLR